MDKTYMDLKNFRLIVIFLVVGFLLLIPLIAMQFTAEVNWTLFDFIVMGVLLLGTGAAFELAMRVAKTTGQRLAFGALVLIVFLLIWAELAVGIFGTPFAGS